MLGIDLSIFVTEKNIVFLTFLAAPQGLTTVHAAFPAIRIVTASVGAKLEEREFPVQACVILGTAAGDADFGARHQFQNSKSSKRSNASHGDTAEPKTQQAWVISPGEFRDQLGSPRWHLWVESEHIFTHLSSRYRQPRKQILWSLGQIMVCI